MTDKINELMATEVMGWELSTDSGGQLYAFRDLGGNVKWNPTTDMNQAMECVEKCNYYFVLERVKEPFLENEHKYNVLLRENSKNEWHGSDESAALAICKAILKAKEIKYE